jgi:endonuclease YncB( thermonuclease family)/DNA/RNA endonuclease G (NUC1)
MFRSNQTGLRLATALSRSNLLTQQNVHVRDVVGGYTFSPLSLEGQMHRSFLPLILGMLIACVSLTRAEQPRTFTARVISANDGDTCKVRDDNGRFYRLRLFGIDAPESDQPYGIIARDALRDLIQGVDIEVRTTGAKTYGRHVARLFRDGLDVNQEMIADGLAWHYDQYTEGDEADELDQLQADARNGEVGLWSQPDPVKPECWRRGDRTGDCVPDHDFPRPERSEMLARAFGSKQLNPVERYERFRSSESPRPKRSTAPSRARAAAGHVIFGRPIPSDDRFQFTPPGEDDPVEGVTELERIAFTLGHYDRFRLPAWVAMRWTQSDYENGVGVSLDRPSPSVDGELPSYARGGTSFEYSDTGLQRGHMARDDDMESWGESAVAQAMRMSNMVPQLEGRNHAVWTLLEEAHKNIVGEEDDDFDIDTIWIIAGPIFREDSPPRVGQPGTAVPDATYKIIAWNNANGDFTARAYVIDQMAHDTDLWDYLKTIDEVEAETGLDFFPELDDDLEETLESAEHDTMWE